MGERYVKNKITELSWRSRHASLLQSLFTAPCFTRATISARFRAQLAGTVVAFLAQ